MVVLAEMSQKRGLWALAATTKAVCGTWQDQEWREHLSTARAVQDWSTMVSSVEVGATLGS